MNCLRGIPISGLFLLAAVSGAIAAEPAPGSATEPAQGSAAQPFWTEELVSGLNVPWSVVWLPDGDMLILEKFGGLRIVRHGKLDPRPIPGVPKAYMAGTNGLLDLALDPDFSTNQRIFLTFDDGDENLVHSSLFRARFDGKALVDGKVIFRAAPQSDLSPHPSVTRIVFLPDKTLLLSSGVDDMRRMMAQHLDNDLGKILRLDRDGQPPSDNPFVGKPGVLPEIYAYGVRNAIGLTRDPVTGTIWENENAARGGDELNIIKPGANYGWPAVTYSTEYSGEQISGVHEAPGIVPPIAYWIPSIAPSGLTVVTSKRYPGWQGDLLLGALGGRHLRHVVIKDDKAVSQEILLKDINERIRDVKQGPDGFIYVLTDNHNGRLLRLQPGTPSQAQLPLVAKALPVSNPTIDTLDLKERKMDPAHGKQLFGQQCASCHTAQANGPSNVGPNLASVIGRTAASTNYPYSPAMKAAGVVWNGSTLYRFLAGPQSFVPKTTMAAAPVTSPQDRFDIIGYLQSCCVAPGAHATMSTH
jgi:glucose/arabinose dehydrogenase/cytochrome c2